VEIAIMAVLLSSFLLVAGTVTSNDIESVYLQRRLKMVEEQIALRDVCDEEVLRAMRTVPRHKFVPEHLTDMAYCDTPLPIGMGQTISQPYIVAYMTELLGPVKGRKILEIGTGSGYQSAMLAEMGADVYTVEILEPLSLFARSVINGLGYQNVHFKTGDGYLGWEENAPYDGIIVTAAPGKIPEPLKNQLREGGKMVIPVGDGMQELLLLTKSNDGFDEEKVAPVAFVPMKLPCSRLTTAPEVIDTPLPPLPEMTFRAPADVPRSLIGALGQHFDEAQLVELAAAIAWENYRARFNRAFDVQAVGYSEGAACALPERTA